MRDHQEAERRLFAVAARLEVFGLDELWKHPQVFYHYGWISKTLLKWWREDGLTERMDKGGRWQRGFPWTQCGRGSNYNGTKAIYRWIEE